MFGSAKDVLVADIGGTNARFALIDSSGRIVASTQYKSAEKASFDAALADFLRMDALKSRKIERASIAIAGMINKDRSFGQLTHINWTVDVAEVKKNFNLKDVMLLNDFEALGFAIDRLSKDEYIELTSKGMTTQGTVALIGAGTGLGMSILYDYGKGHMPLPSEGGHTDLPISPQSKLELELYAYLRKQGEVLDSESVLSGRGLESLYLFMLKKNVKHDAKITLEIKKAADRPALITKYALEDKDAACVKAVEMFIMLYARASRNLAITSLCSSLVIGGGIAPKIVPMLRESFVEAFCDHQSKYIRSMLENIPIIVIVDDKATLLGAYQALRLQ